MNRKYLWLCGLIACLSCDHPASQGTQQSGVTTVSEQPDPCRQDTFYFDSYLTECLNSHDGYTTMGMADCFEQASVYLDTIMERTYKALYDKLDTVDRKLLSKSQDDWLLYRSAESAFLYSTFYTWVNYSKYGHGRESVIDQAAWKYDVVRERLMRLMQYNEQVFVVDEIPEED